MLQSDPAGSDCNHAQAPSPYPALRLKPPWMG